MKKNGDANNNPKLIILLAIVFTLGGAGALVYTFVKEFDWFVFLISLLLFVVGITFFVYGFIRFKALNKYKKLIEDPNAFVTAKFISAKLSSFTTHSIGFNNIDIPTKINAYKKIIYEYVDENGVTRKVKSQLSYVPKQVDYLKTKGTFKIKCKGATSVIIEELPEMNKMFNV